VLEMSLDVIDPSPVILPAVQILSSAKYNAIIRQIIPESKPSIESSSPMAVMTAPPGTPGAAIMVTPKMSIKGNMLENVAALACKNNTANAQLTSVIVLPDK